MAVKSGEYGGRKTNSNPQKCQTVLELFKDQGIDRERITTVDTSKVDEALNVTNLSTEELQREIEDLEARIDELTSFSSATEFE